MSNRRGVSIFSSVIDTSVERVTETEISDGQVVTRWFDVSTVEPRLAPAEAPEGKAVERDGGSQTTRNKDEALNASTITFRASVESEDRAGDVIKAEGWELDNYRSNPVVLWAHRHDLLPVGKSVDIWIEKEALMATIEFAPTEFAQQIRRLFEDGFLRGVSVGFRALKSSPRSASNGSSHRSGTVFERQELLEISAAPVPMHPFALATGSGGLTAGSRASGHIETDQRELIPLFRELTDIWQSIATVGRDSRREQGVVSHPANTVL